jgi:ureidoacrylate peracid hydrolase
MPEKIRGPDIALSALIIVDMQNDFLHPDGSFGRRAAEHPELGIDLPFFMSTIPHVKRLANAFRAASRPVIYVAHILKHDYSDAAFPYWRLRLQPATGNSTHCVEGTWGAEIIDELRPHEDDHLVAKIRPRRVCEHRTRYDSSQYGRNYLRCGRGHHMRLQHCSRWGRT